MILYEFPYRRRRTAGDLDQKSDRDLRQCITIYLHAVNMTRSDSNTHRGIFVHEGLFFLVARIPSVGHTSMFVHQRYFLPSTYNMVSSEFS